MEKTYTIKEIEKALSKCKKFNVHIDTPPEIDGDLDIDIETVEVSLFLHHLKNSEKSKITKGIEEWFNTYFAEEWVEVTDCKINFSKYTPSGVSSSLHITEERYDDIKGETYRLLYAIGGDTPTIERLKKK